MDRPRRRPPLREIGHEPDYRFSLANERTFLAWIRTALALIAGGVALANLVPDLTPELLRDGLAILLVLLAVALVVRSRARWDRAERAIRQDLPLEVGGGLRRTAGERGAVHDRRGAATPSDDHGVGCRRPVGRRTPR